MQTKSETSCTHRVMTENKKQSFQNMRREILRRRYLRKNKDGKVTETEDQMYRRVANTMATVEAKYGATEAQVKAYADKFYQLMKDYKFLPNTPTLMNSGREDGVLSACFVLPINDSIDEIFDTVKSTALIQKAGGGTGFCLDKLRPTGDIVRSSGGTTSGPMSFLRVLSGTTTAIQQGAFRRGANMGMMSIGHPDILKFLHAKKDINALGNFNLSVKVADTFMKKLSKASEPPHVVVNPRTKKRYLIPHSAIIDSYTIDDLVPAADADGDCYTVKEVWDLIITNAHASGEPGVSYIERVNKDNPTPKLGRIEASNPCGEQYLLPYESCNLGSVNVSKFVRKDRTDLDWRSLAKTIKIAVRFLDDVIDANHWPVAQIGRITLGNRKIGLGVMGFYDALVLLGIRYDSHQAVDFAGKLAGFIQERAHLASEQLAKEKGTFPNWPGSVWDTKYHRQMRNASCTCIAPTGSISIIAGCSSGIEPVFSIASKRRVLEGKEFVMLHPLVERLGSEEGWLSDRVRNLLIQGIPPRNIPEIPKKLQEVLLTAHQIRPEWHVKVQAAFQRNIDNAVSKSVNVPSTTTIEEVDQIYRLAYKLDCKGITVFRDTSRPDPGYQYRLSNG